jgi:chromosome segregation ATPase
MKVASLLGEDVANPKITFRSIEGLLDERITLLSKKLYEYTKEHDKEKQTYENIESEADNDLDDVESDLFFRIKNSITNLHNDVDKLDAESLLLQKQITTLKKEKVDLINQLNGLNLKLDNLESDLGINISAKRTKKKN